MTAILFLQVYALLGLAAAVLAFVRGSASSLPGKLGHALLALGLWPFLLPVVLAPGKAPAPADGGARSARFQRLDEIEGRLEACWKQAAAESTWAAQQARERRLLDGFLARIRVQERRLVELERALATAPASVRERLGRIHEHSVAELEHSVGLVEELAAQLTLLRFADLAAPTAQGVEREHVEELLLRIEALAEASDPQGPPRAQA